MSELRCFFAKMSSDEVGPHIDWPRWKKRRRKRHLLARLEDMQLLLGFSQLLHCICEIRLVGISKRGLLLQGSLSTCGCGLSCTYSCLCHSGVLLQGTLSSCSCELGSARFLLERLDLQIQCFTVDPDLPCVLIGLFSSVCGRCIAIERQDMLLFEPRVQNLCISMIGTTDS